MYKDFQEKEKPIQGGFIGERSVLTVHLINGKFSNLLGFILRMTAECCSKELEGGYLRTSKASSPK